MLTKIRVPKFEFTRTTVFRRVGTWLDENPDWWFYPTAIAVIVMAMIVASRFTSFPSLH